jgi:hypothetical protein
MINREPSSFDFEDARQEPYTDGYFDPGHDRLLHMFSLVHPGGKCPQIIKPGSFK